MWTFRYSSQGKSRSLFFSKHVATLRELYPERQILQEIAEDSRLVVSEPDRRSGRRLGRGSRIVLRVVGRGEDCLNHFTIKPPTTAAAINR